MSSIIKINHLYKKYQLHNQQSSYLSLRNTLSNLFSFQAKKEYFWALQDIHFNIQEGEVIGIIGRNGSGKSTLLKILSKISPPTKGFIKIKGRIAALLEVGTGFHPELTGRENIFLNGSVLGMKYHEVKKHFDDIIAFSGVETFIDSPLKYYSSGMKLRLAFAVAAHLEPEILVIDEILAVGDLAFQKKCLGKMNEVAKSGRTVLFVSHQMQAVSNLCTRGIVLDTGKIIFDGTVQNAINKYTTLQLNQQITSLNNRIDRTGNGKIKFTDTWVENSQGNKVTNINIGDTIKIVALYDCHHYQPSSLHVAIAINAISGVKMTDLSNTIAGYEFENIPASGRLECTIPNLPFNTGAYFYNLLVSEGQNIADWIQQAHAFEVLATDFYNTGKLPDTARAVVLPQAWQLKAL